MTAEPMPATGTRPVPVAAPRRGYGVVANDRRFVAFTVLLSVGLIAPTTLWILLAVYAKANFGLPEYLYGWIPTANALMCVFLQYPVTSITKRYRALPVVAVGMGIYAIGAGSVAIMSSFPGFLLSMVILTVGELIVVPVASKYVADLAPPDLRGRYMSVYWLGWAASRAAAPLIGGFVNDQVAPIAIWYVAFLIGVGSTAGLVALARRSDAAERAARDGAMAPA
jgi:MFS family permease